MNRETATLAGEIAALRQQPNIDIHTLVSVERVLSRYAGRRLTVGRGHGRAGLLQRVQTIVGACPACTSTAQIAQLIASALGVHRATAYRYLQTLGYEITPALPQKELKAQKDL